MSNKFKVGIDPLNIMWDDIRFPLVANRLDITSGRIDYDYINGAVGFASNARYPNEPVSMLCQVQHDWKGESELRPHIHWVQQGSDEPNWLLAYKKIENGEAFTVETDYSGHTFLTKDNNAYTYTSGTIVQITNFQAISMAGITQSSYMVHFVLFRDSANTSGEFTGSDTSSIEELVFEFDVHYQKDSQGSRQEFVK